MIQTFSKKQVAPWLLLGVILFSLVIRAYQVRTLPKILNRDEAALAYNASLIQQTGRDEWQQSWPLSFKSFGDYKLPGYIYTLAGLFKFAPKNEFIVRLPSVLAGVILSGLAYYLAQELNLSLRYRLLLAGLTATTPVFIFFSRIAFEANLALSFLILALICMLKKKDLGAILAMVLAILTYNSPLLLLPFILISVPFLRGFKKFKSWRWLVIGWGLTLLLAGAFLFSLSTQKSNITIFQDETVWRESVLYRQQFSGWKKTFFGNRYLYYSQLIAENYLKSFSPQFLVLGGGGHPWHSVPETGHLYVVVYGLALVGLLVGATEILTQIMRHQLKREHQLKLWLLYLTFVSLLPATITVDAPHATRSLLFFFLLLIWAVIGYQKIDRWVFKKRRHIWLWLVVILVAVETSGYLQTYFGRYRQQQQVLKPGFEKVIQEVEQKYPQQAIAVVDPDGFEYVRLAWYLRFSAKNYWQSVIMQQADKIGLHYGQQVGRYHFIAQEKDQSEKERVVVRWNGSEWKVKED